MQDTANQERFLWQRATQQLQQRARSGHDVLAVWDEYAFLLSLLVPWLQQLRRTLLTTWCHRTGKRSQKCLTPLYRLRAALSRLWLAHPPPLTLLPSRANSG